MLPILSTLNFAAIFLAAIVSLVIGLIYYSPNVAGKAWMKSINKKIPAKMKMEGMGGMIMLMFITSLVLAFILSIFLHWLQPSSLMQAWGVGFLVWIGFFATSKVPSVVFEGRPPAYFWITEAENLINILVMTTILMLLF